MQGKFSIFAGFCWKGNFSFWNDRWLLPSQVVSLPSEFAEKSFFSIHFSAPNCWMSNSWTLQGLLWMICFILKNGWNWKLSFYIRNKQTMGKCSKNLDIVHWIEILGSEVRFTSKLFLKTSRIISNSSRFSYFTKKISRYDVPIPWSIMFCVFPVIDQIFADFIMFTFKNYA